LDKPNPVKSSSQNMETVKFPVSDKTVYQDLGRFCSGVSICEVLCMRHCANEAIFWL
jgi:hypothetical protein